MLFTIIIASQGTRLKALNLAISSILNAVDFASEEFSAEQVEVLVGFDGIKGERVHSWNRVHYFDLPKDNNWGHGLRNILLKRAKGKRIIFLDDDNALTPNAFITYMKHQTAEMLIARIDVSRAFECDFLPLDIPGKSIVRQGNIDPLCLCLSRELVFVRCGGWTGQGGYQADYVNILQCYRRSRRTEVVHDVVGIYDAGLGLDSEGINFRQDKLLQAGIKSKPLI
ncbi:MAG: glycosyltransferase [Desulfonatronovibrio sp.]